MRHILALAAAAVIAGCATEPQAPASTAAAANSTVASASPQQVCTKEMPAGSQIFKTVCHDVQSDADQQQLQNSLDRMRQSAPMPVAPGGR